MKKIISIAVALFMLCGIFTVSADSYQNNVYTFTAVNTTATFDAEGESLFIDTEAVLRFERSSVKMNLEGDADTVMLQEVVLTKYDDSEITYTLQSADSLKSVVFKNGKFEELSIDQGAYLLVLSTVEEKGSAVMLLVGEQTVVPEESVQPDAAEVFGSNSVYSGWAVTELTEAYDNSLVTVELYKNGNYTRNISRGEFARIAAQVLIQCGADYDSFAKGLDGESAFKFTDTDGDLMIEFVSHCGVINGISETEFSPDGELTREQAAAMLSRIVTYLGTEPTVNTVSAFSDEAQFSDWARNSIYTVAGLYDKVNSLAVMGGTGEGIFSPNTGYTVEQALISAKRLLRAVK